MEILQLGDFMQKKVKQIICYFIISVIAITTLSGCSKKSDDELLKEKLGSEMRYLDSTFSSMLNKANGLTFQNYKVVSKKVQEKSQDGGNNSSSGEAAKSGQSQEQGGESSGGGDSESSSGGSSVGGDSPGGSKTQVSNIQYKMQENSILSQDKKPKWDELKTDIESVYTELSTITLDLYKQNIENQNILNFNTDLDTATKAIKDENKEKTLTSLAKLYSYIPTYFSNSSDDKMQSELYKVKSNVFNAYSIIEQNNSGEVKKQLKLAEDSLVSMMNNVGKENQSKEQNISKSYILLKDLQASVNNKDLDIFYIKYKNLMEELALL